MRSYLLFIGLLVLPVVDASSPHAQTQSRNFNLNCGLIGKFVRYPPHLQHCRALVVCDDHQMCLRKKSIQRKLPAAQLAFSVPELNEEVSDAPGNANPGDPASNPTGGSLGATVSAGADLSGGGVGAGAKGGASIDSGSNDSVSGGLSGGVSAGGVQAGAGGSLGVGGL